MAKILVIDDVSTNRDVITTLLGYFGHQLLQAHDGREGLKIVVAERPDLVIVDILMPTMSGYEFVSRLRHDPLVNSTPVIFYSATFLEGETRALARACGVSHILTKPSNPEEILRVVNDVLVNRFETSPAPSGELPSVVDVVQVLNNKLFQKNKELADLNARLEQIVASRTAELQKTNDQLKEQIGERERAEEHVRQLQKLEAIGRLAGGVAHDFNNLLGVILGRCELLRGSSAVNEDMQRSIELIERSAERGAKLTQQLLAFGRRQVLQPSIVNLNEVVTELRNLLERLIGEDIDLSFHLDWRLGRVLADQSQLEQVLMNLAVNARDAMPSGGKLTITTENVRLDLDYVSSHSAVKAGSYAMLTVSDTGCGMDAETQSRIFEPFFTTKEKGRGTGLGLATVYGIVKQSGGYIWAYSEPGHGTTFKIYIPLATAQTQGDVVVPQATERPGRGSETVLVVEDDDDLRELTCEFLQASGYTVIQAAGPSEALSTATQHQGAIDLLLSDVIMPGMSARELATQLSAAQPKIKVLYISGYPDDAIVRHGILEREQAFLQKPFTRHALTSKIRDVLEEQSGDVGAAQPAHPHASPI